MSYEPDGLREAFKARLVEHGWRALDHEKHSAIACKLFDTAVGEKEAFVYVQDFGNSTESVRLAGCYYSEGRDILEPHGRLVPRGADAQTVAQLVAEFAAGVDDVVAKSYAARLGRRRRKP